MTRRPLSVAVLSRAVYPVHGYGGLERHVHDLVGHLLRRDIAVVLITRAPQHGEGQRDLPELFRDPRLTIHWVPYRTFPFAGRRGTTILDRSTAYPLFGYHAGRVAARLAGRGEIDLVHGLGASALGYARLRRQYRAPLVFNPQGLEEFGGGRAAGAPLKRIGYLPLQVAVRACARAADRTLATDRSLIATVTERLRIPAARVRLVPNAIDLEVCDRLAGPDDGRAVRAREGYAQDVPVLVSAGRLEANKGFQTLVDALQSMLDLDWRWVLIGDGPYRPALERFIRGAGLTDRVRLVGRVDDRALHAWYEAATLFVHPTHYEGSSLVTLEAMAHRRAVVATTAGGLPDKVTPGGSGWLVEPGRPEPLAAALRDALAARDQLRPMGDEGRARVEREFAWPIVVSRLLDVYREVLPHGRAEALPHR